MLFQVLRALRRKRKQRKALSLWNRVGTGWGPIHEAIKKNDPDTIDALIDRYVSGPYGTGYIRSHYFELCQSTYPTEVRQKVARKLLEALRSQSPPMGITADTWNTAQYEVIQIGSFGSNRPALLMNSRVWTMVELVRKQVPGLGDEIARVVQINFTDEEQDVFYRYFE